MILKFKNLKFSSYLLVIVLLFFIPIYVLSSILSISNNTQHNLEDFDSLRLQDETYVNSSIHLIDDGWKLFEKTLEPDMIDVLLTFREELNLVGNDINLLNLSRIQKEQEKFYDYFIMNTSGIIVKTTYENDLGLNLSTAGFFQRNSSSILASNETFLQRITTEILTGIYRKYGYISSFDHNYILEIGLESSVLKNISADFNYLKVKDALEEINPYLKSIKIYNYLGYELGNYEFEPTQQFKEFMGELYRAEENREFFNKSSNLLISYIIVDLYDENYIGISARIVELTYDMNVLDVKIEQETNYAIFQGFVILFMLVGGSIFISRLFSNRFTKIVEGINQIGKGNLDYQIGNQTIEEFNSLAHNINQMAKQLKFNQAELAKHHEHLEELVESRTAKLLVANKELEAFAYSVSHDLRAPLRAVDGFTRILMEEYVEKLDAEGKRLGVVIQENTERMSELIDDILNLSRLGRTAMRFSEIDMKKLVNTIYHEATSPEDRERIEFNVSNLPGAVGDPTMMRQVWMNLIYNAIKFSTHREQAVISVTCREEEDKLIYCIKDNGAGFDMRYKDKLFGLFQRLHRESEFKGTGVGLAIVQRIIHRHDGKVWGVGEVDKCAMFYFSLPKNRRTQKCTMKLKS